MRTTMLALALALTGCLDAPTTDPVESCDLATDVEPAAAGIAPGGAWLVEWTCIDGCDGERPAITLSTRLDVVPGGTLSWHAGPLMFASAAGAADGACWRFPSEPGECRSDLLVCDAANGLIGVRAVAWSDSGEMQVWKMRGQR